ncbi:low molecular weight phosphatase family protein [Cellulosimicrobium sp. NPDC057127]|uniref:arsenate reductase/protein-tyrosine-phosphatase family protein n=1 Tax=Cellulosimicrobium sp. NPDC057127 TaxID=3346026 RepID=UPI003640DD4F
MLRLLAVCTGNICRSPAAQLLLADELDGSVEVTSAGTHAVVGAPVAEPVARRLAGLGLDHSGFAARALTPAIVRAADLVVTMTAAQRAVVLEDSPGALRRTFLLSELTSLAEHAGPDLQGTGDAARLRSLVTSAGRVRARLGGVSTPDVEDPYGRDDDVHARVLDELRTYVARLGRALRA